MLGLAKSFSEIVQRYRADHPGGRQEIAYFRNMPNLSVALKKAGLAQGPGDRTFSHQWRVPPRARAAAATQLLKNKDRLRLSRTFADLFVTIGELLGPVHGIGELTVYDTAVRVGAYLGLLPQRVYLHAGVREGAMALGLSPRAESVDLADLPKEFRRLHAHEAEDVLCIFRDDLRALRDGSRPARLKGKPRRCLPPRRRPTTTCG